MEYEGLLEIDTGFRKQGIASFGTYVSRISWGPLSSTDHTAAIRDCMDQSKFGTYDTSNNKAITIGTSRVNLNVTFESVDGRWKVFAIYKPAGEPC